MSTEQIRLEHSEGTDGRTDGHVGEIEAAIDVSPSLSLSLSLSLPLPFLLPPSLLLSFLPVSNLD